MDIFVEGKNLEEVLVFLKGDFLESMFLSVPDAKTSGIAVLFGSVVKGLAKKGSDVDVMLFFAGGYFKTK